MHGQYNPRTRIALVGQRTFEKYTKEPDYNMFLMQVSHLEKDYDVDDEDNEEILRKQIPPEYHEYLDLFRKKEGEKLPPY